MSTSKQINQIALKYHSKVLTISFSLALNVWDSEKKMTRPLIPSDLHSLSFSSLSTLILKGPCSQHFAALAVGFLHFKTDLFVLKRFTRQLFHYLFAGLLARHGRWPVPTTSVVCFYDSWLYWWYAIAGYAAKTKLTSHQMNVHIRSRPYKCRLAGCDADFNELSNRNAHEKGDL